MKVTDAYTAKVESCRPETNLAEAVSLMWKADAGALPIVKEDGTVQGIITDRDICVALATQGRLANEIQVREVKEEGVHTVGADVDVKDALARMKEVRVRRLPVVDKGGHLKGMISLDDISLLAKSGKKAKKNDVKLEEVALTLQAICEYQAKKGRVQREEQVEA